MTSTKPIVVMIPGGFFSPRPYKQVRDLLENHGHQVIVPDLTVCGDLSSKTPESGEWKDMAQKGAEDDAKQVHSLLLPLLDQGHHAVLVGHSYGSLVALLTVQGQTVAERAAKGLKGGIVKYVTVAGFAYPVHGKNLYGNDDDLPLMPYHDLESGILNLSEDAKPLFFSDLSPEARDDAWSQVFKTQSRKSLLLKPDFIESDIKIPKTYIFCEKDETVNPEYQQSFSTIGAFDNIVKIPTGHVPFLSMPEKVAEIVMDISRE